MRTKLPCASSIVRAAELLAADAKKKDKRVKQKDLVSKEEGMDVADS